MTKHLTTSLAKYTYVENNSGVEGYASWILKYWASITQKNKINSAKVMP